MVREESSVQKSRSFRLKKMFEIPGRQAHSYVLEGKNGGEAIDDKQFRSHGAKVAPIELIGSVFNPSGEKGPVSRLSKEGGRGFSPHSKDQQPSGMPFGNPNVSFKLCIRIWCIFQSLSNVFVPFTR